MMIYSITFVVYLTVMIGVGIYCSKKATADMEGFLLAGRGLNEWVLMATLGATFFGGFVWTGYAGYGYTHGVSGQWMYWTNLPGLAIFGLFFATKARKLSAYTPADLLDARFGRQARIPAAIGFGVYCISFVAMQYVVIAQTLQTLLGWPYGVSYLIGFAVVTAYCFAGGLLAVVMTDVVQFIMLSIGAIALFFTSFSKVGGFSGLHTALPDPAFWDPFALGLVSILALIGINTTSAAVMPPELVQRAFAAKSPKAIWKGYLGFLAISIFWFVPAYTGVVGRGLFGPDIPAGAVVSKMMIELWPPVIGALFLSALMAAIMSSADSYLNVAVSYGVRDIYQKFYKSDASEKDLVRVARLMTIGISLFALALGKIMPDIYTIYYYGGAMKAAIIPVIVFAFFVPRTNPKAAVIASWMAIILTVVYKMFWFNIFGYPEVFVALGISTSLLIVLTYAFPPAPKHRAVSYWNELEKATKPIDLEELLAKMDQIEMERA